MRIEIVTNSTQETEAAGTALARSLMAGAVVAMYGDLGAGKTTLTQGIAKGLDIKRNVTSPTFTILKIYHGRMPLYHIDAYRLEGLDQELGFEEFLDDDGLTVIEWSQYVPSLLPDDYLSVSIRLLQDDRREFQLQANGAAYEQLLEEMK